MSKHKRNVKVRVSMLLILWRHSTEKTHLVTNGTSHKSASLLLRNHLTHFSRGDNIHWRSLTFRECVFLVLLSKNKINGPLLWLVYYCIWNWRVSPISAPFTLDYTNIIVFLKNLCSSMFEVLFLSLHNLLRKLKNNSKICLAPWSSAFMETGPTVPCSDYLFFLWW